jgi:hypothetical protein
MRLGKAATCELLSPILRPLKECVCGAMDEYNETFSDRQKAYPSGLRSRFLQAAVVAAVSQNSEIMGLYVPREARSRQCLILSGDTPHTVVVMFNQATTWHGRLRCARNRHSEQDIRALQDSLVLDGHETIVIRCFWQLQFPLILTKPSIQCVGIGEHDPKGFIWTHRFWSEGEGFAAGVADVDPMLPHMPKTEVRLKRATAPSQPSKVGTREEEERLIAEKKSEEGKKSKDGEGGKRA